MVISHFSIIVISHSILSKLYLIIKLPINYRQNTISVYKADRFITYWVHIVIYGNSNPHNPFREIRISI